MATGLVLATRFPSLAHAHQASLTYSTITVAPDGKTVSYRLQLSSRDLYEALGLDEDRDASDAEILAGRERLGAYVLERVHIRDGTTPCPMALHRLDVVTQTDRFARLDLAATCPGPITSLVVDYDLFFDLDAKHTGMIEVHARGETVRRELGAQASRFEWALAGAVPESTSALGFVAHGVDHIFGGYDHIAFLLGLLLVAALRRRSTSGEASGSESIVARPHGDAITTVLKTVTAFTVAHSLTLIAAALGWIALPSRLVESAIAASIVYVAVENILVAEPRARWPLAFGFGLVHGLGFASVLAPLLPPKDLIVPLLAFNVGVELGQLAVIACAWPLVRAAVRAGRERLLVEVGSSALCALGVFWLVVRTFGR
jgi:hypothetical protein